MKNLLILSSSLLLVALLAGCEKSYDEPAEWTPVTMQPNMTIAQLKALYKGPNTAVNAPDAIVAGKVISTDKYGNFYRVFYIQDETSGIEIKIGKSTWYNTYKIGQEIYIKPHHLYLGDNRGMVSLGMPSTDTRYENSWIDAPMLIGSTIFRGEMKAPIAPVEILSTADMTEARMGTWVTLREVTYKSGATDASLPIDTWALKNDPNTTADDSDNGNQIFTLKNGGEVTVRTSGYAKFASTKVPFVAGTTKGNITGVLTRYNTTYQLILNTDKDVEVVE
jgi:hypothetical protein